MIEEKTIEIGCVRKLGQTLRAAAEELVMIFGGEEEEEEERKRV